MNSMRTTLFSPLVEKRVLFFSARKSLIGRRAYSDSIYTKQKQSATIVRPMTAAAVEEVVTPSPTSKELLEIAFTVSAC